jgi:hypothetical protein
MIESWIGLNSIKKQFQFLLQIFFPFDLWYGWDVVLFFKQRPATTTTTTTATTTKAATTF